MKIDFSMPILDLNEEPVKDVNGKIMTLGDAVQNALLSSYPDEQNLDGKAKFDRFMLATQTKLNGSQKLSVEDVATIKKLTAKCYGPLVVGRVYQLVEKELEDGG